MLFTRTVAYLTAGVLEMGGFIEADKSPWLPIAGGVTGVALLDFFSGEMFRLPLNTLERYALFGIAHEIVVLFGMALFANQ